MAPSLRAGTPQLSGVWSRATATPLATGAALPAWPELLAQPLAVPESVLPQPPAQGSEGVSSLGSGAWLCRTWEGLVLPLGLPRALQGLSREDVGGPSAHPSSAEQMRGERRPGLWAPRH